MTLSDSQIRKHKHLIKLVQTVQMTFSHIAINVIYVFPRKDWLYSLLLQSQRQLCIFESPFYATTTYTPRDPNISVNTESDTPKYERNSSRNFKYVSKYNKLICLLF